MGRKKNRSVASVVIATIVGEALIFGVSFFSYYFVFHSLFKLLPEISSCPNCPVIQLGKYSLYDSYSPSDENPCGYAYFTENAVHQTSNKIFAKTSSNPNESKEIYFTVNFIDGEITTYLNFPNYPIYQNWDFYEYTYTFGEKNYSSSVVLTFTHQEIEEDGIFRYFTLSFNRSYFYGFYESPFQVDI